jgi:putative ABC transport system permease protein
MRASLRYAWRSLRRTPVFTITAVLTLVIGLAATIAIFAVVDGVLLKPLPYGNPDRLVRAWFDLPPMNLKRTQQTQSTYYTFQRLAKTIEGIGLYQEGSVNVSEPGGKTEPQRLAVAWVTSTLVPVLKVSPILGRSISAEEDLPPVARTGAGSRDVGDVVMISEGLWRTRFGGDPSIIGKLLEVNGRSREIIGVMAARFRFPAATTQLWLPLGLDPNNRFPGGFKYNSVARLKPGFSVADAERDFAAVLPRMVELYPTFAPGLSAQMLMDQAKPVPKLVPLQDAITGGIAKTLWMVTAAAALVLLVACANVTNLVLVRSDGRQRELAVREALGAGRARVILHFLSESALLTVIATVVAVGLAWAALRVLVASTSVQIPRLAEVHIDATVSAFAIIIAALVTVVCTLVPALRIGRVHLSNALREGGRSGTASRAQHRIRGAMVAVQIALALVVLAGSGLLLRTFQQLTAVKPGFNPENVVSFWLSPSRARYPSDTSLVRFYADLVDRARALPGVREVGISSRIPLVGHGMSQDPLFLEDDPEYTTKIPPLALFTTTDGGYFRAMGIPLVAGRTFDRLVSQNDREVVISQTTALQFWKDSTGREAIGKRFRDEPGGPLYTVIGVVGNTRDTALAALPPRVVYLPVAMPSGTSANQLQRTFALVVRTQGDPSAIIPAVQRLVRDVDPSLPTFDVRTMRNAVSASVAQLSFMTAMLATAAIVTLVLGAIGLYGVMAYVVTLRTRELGVRIALGAQPSAVAGMMTKQGLVLTAFGVAGGLGLFFVVARFLRSFLYGVATTDPLTLGGASLVLVAIATLASWIPARRAARVDPADALRAE